jgi:hypothetical protein
MKTLLLLGLLLPFNPFAKSDFKIPAEQMFHVHEELDCEPPVPDFKNTGWHQYKDFEDKLMGDDKPKRLNKFKFWTIK